MQVEGCLRLGLCLAAGAYPRQVARMRQVLHMYLMIAEYLLQGLGCRVSLTH